MQMRMEIGMNKMDDPNLTLKPGAISAIKASKTESRM